MPRPLLFSLLCASLALGQSLTVGPYLQSLSDTEVTICWLTDAPVAGGVRYGPAPGSLSQVVSGSSTRYHFVTLTGLSPSTRYYYAIDDGATVLAGNDAATWFETAPVMGSREPVRIWAAGDVGTGNSDQRDVLEAMLEFSRGRTPDVFLGLGDLAYDDGSESEFRSNFFEPYAGILRNVPAFPCIGNHETYGSRNDWGMGTQWAYYNYFALPVANSGTEAYYSFDHGNVHFVILDSDESSRSPTGPMATWLAADLAATTAEWVIAAFHHPPYTKGSHNSDWESRHIDMRENICPILEAHGVDLVLGGHSHLYERTMLVAGAHDTPTSTGNGSYLVDSGDGSWLGSGVYTKPSGLSADAGAVYVVTGNGGKTSGVSIGYPHVLSEHSEVELGSCVIDVVGAQLTLRHIRDDGTISDMFTIRKGTDTEPPVAFAVDHVSPTEVVVSYSEPVTASSAENVAAYAIAGVPVSAASLAADQVTVTLTTGAHPVGSSYSLSVAGIEDVAGNTAAPAALAYKGVPAPLVVVAPGDTWSWFPGSSDPGSDWALPGYDDSAWATGPSGFGYGDGDDATVVPGMAGSFTTVFTRIDFAIPDASSLLALTLDVDYDDGFAAYLNGVRVAAANAPTTITANSTAGRSHEAGSAEQFVLPLNAAVSGSNTLALVGLNRSTSSSDLSLIASLSRTGGELPGPTGNPGGNTGNTGNSGSPGGNTGNTGNTGGGTAPGSSGSTSGGSSSGGGSCAVGAPVGPLGGLLLLGLVLVFLSRRRAG